MSILASSHDRMTPVLQSSRPPPSSTVFLSSCLPAIGRGQEGDGRLSQSGTSPGLPLTKADSGKNPQSTERDTEITPEVQDSLHSSQSLTALQLAVVSAVIQRYSHWYQRYSHWYQRYSQHRRGSDTDVQCAAPAGRTRPYAAQYTAHFAGCSVQCAVCSV